MVPTIVESIETATATLIDVNMLRRFEASWKIPILSGPLPKNQSMVNPFQGRDGNMESLKARIMVIKRGENKKIKKIVINSLKAAVYAFEFGSVLIILPPS